MHNASDDTDLAKWKDEKQTERHCFSPFVKCIKQKLHLRILFFKNQEFISYFKIITKHWDLNEWFEYFRCCCKICYTVCWGRKCLTSQHFFWRVEIEHVCNRNWSGRMPSLQWLKFNCWSKIRCLFLFIVTINGKKYVNRLLCCCHFSSPFCPFPSEIWINTFFKRKGNACVCSTAACVRCIHRIWKKQLTQTSKFNYIMLMSRVQKCRYRNVFLFSSLSTCVRVFVCLCVNMTVNRIG